MADKVRKKLKSRDAIKTYRYLRISMIMTVVLLVASIGIERSKVSCFQTSISAYYYTPVRAIFAGSLMVIGFALIVIKGRGTFEDTCLNIAGMLAPVVALVPTGDIGAKGEGDLKEEMFRCSPSQPLPRPVTEGSPEEVAKAKAAFEDVVKAIVEANFYALLIAGALGLLVAVVVALAMKFGWFGVTEPVEKGTVVSLTITALLLAGGWAWIRNSEDFFTAAHAPAAYAMFGFLFLAVAGKAWEHWKDSRKIYLGWYVVVGLAMFAGLAIPVFSLFGEHAVFALEAWEILWFALFWLVQTIERWNEEVETSSPSGPVAAARAV